MRPFGRLPRRYPSGPRSPVARVLVSSSEMRVVRQHDVELIRTESRFIFFQKNKQQSAPARENQGQTGPAERTDGSKPGVCKIVRDLACTPRSRSLAQRVPGRPLNLEPSMGSVGPCLSDMWGVRMEERNGVGWLLVVWVVMAGIGACQALSEGNTVVDELELNPLAQCPTPTWPEPVCPMPQGPPSPSCEPRAVGAEVTRGATPAGRRVDLNTATAEELMELPGVGPKTARAIVRRRQARPFSRARQLRGIHGIGPRKWRRLKGLVEVNPKDP